MRDRPDAAFLLALARQAATDGEAPELLARARAIAERERAAGDAPVERFAGAGGALWRWRIGSLLRRLAAEIRAGAADAPGAEQTALRRLLWAMTREKLAESDPDYLAAAAAAGAAPG